MTITEIELIRNYPKELANHIYYMNLAIAVSRRSTCLDKQVGAIVVNDAGKIISTGYNGAPKGLIHCTDCDYCHKEQGDSCIATHAEANALLQAGQEAVGCILYVTHSPCLECSKLIINAKIKKVVAYEKYSKHTQCPKLCPDMLLHDAKIPIYFLKNRLSPQQENKCDTCGLRHEPLYLNLYQISHIQVHQRKEYDNVCDECFNYDKYTPEKTAS